MKVTKIKTDLLVTDNNVGAALNIREERSNAGQLRDTVDAVILNNI